MLDQIRKIGWLAVELGLLLVVLCVLLNILLGKDSGAYIAVPDPRTKVIWLTEQTADKIARYDPDKPCSLQELLTLADARMYQEKSAKKAAAAAA